jgi:hypothetical protein
MKAPRFEGAGQGENSSTKYPPDTPLAQDRQRIDPRLAFLACASARLMLVESGAMTLDEALDDAFIEQFRSVAEITCRCERETLAAFDRAHRQLCERRFRAWRWSRS